MGKKLPNPEELRKELIEFLNTLHAIITVKDPRLAALPEVQQWLAEVADRINKEFGFTLCGTIASQ